MARATEQQTNAHDPGQPWLFVGGTLVALAFPAAIVGALWLVSASSGDLLAMVLAVLAADPTTLGIPKALVYWGVTGSAVGTWLVGAGLVLEGLSGH